MASSVEPTHSHSAGLWPRLIALFFTALVGWFFGVFVGSMVSGPSESALLAEYTAATRAADPTNVPAVAPAASPTTITAIATVAPTASPTAAPAPTPPGRGATLQGSGLTVHLVDYELRSESHPENAAVQYSLRFINSGAQAMQVRLNLADIKALDSTGVAYVDYFAGANQFAQARCGVSPTSPQYATELTIQVPAQGNKEFSFYLNRQGTEGDCRNRGDGRSRVAQSVQFVDLQLGTIVYTIGEPRELPGAWWRLNRTP